MLTSLLKKGLMTMGLCAISASAYAQVEGYEVYVDCDEFVPGEESEIRFCLDNEVTIKGFQMSITLPDGLSFQTEDYGDEEEVILNLSSRIRNFSLTGSINENGNLIVACLSLSGRVITGNSGALFSAPIDVAEDFVGGTLKLEDVRVSATINEDVSNTESVKLGDYSFELEAASTFVEVTDIKISYNEEEVSEIEMTEGDEYTFIATVAPEDATENTVIWSIANAAQNTRVDTLDDDASTVASIVINSENGNEVTVTALTPGTALLTATAGNVTKTVTITVNAKTIDVTEITLSQTTADIKEGETLTLTATVTPEDATVNSLTWSSSDTAVATVEEGVVTAVAQGTATITVASVSNPEVKATCEVTVTTTVGVEGIAVDVEGYYNVCNINGQAVVKTRNINDILYLKKGIYIINGKKVVVK